MWFFCRNWNVIVSPTWAVMFDGMNERMFRPPTTTVWSAENDVDVVELTEDGAVGVAPESVTEAEAVPTVVDGEAGAVVCTADDVSGGLATGVVDISGGAVALENEDTFVALPIALAWNAANWFPGLMAKTIPC